MVYIKIIERSTQNNKVTSPVRYDDRVVELAAAVLAQGSAPSVGYDSISAMKLVKPQVIGCAGPSYGAGAPWGHDGGAV